MGERAFREMPSLKPLTEIKQTSTAGETKKAVPPQPGTVTAKLGFVCLDVRGAVSLWILPEKGKQGIAQEKKSS